MPRMFKKVYRWEKSASGGKDRIRGKDAKGEVKRLPQQ